MRRLRSLFLKGRKNFSRSSPTGVASLELSDAAAADPGDEALNDPGAVHPSQSTGIAMDEHVLSHEFGKILVMALDLQDDLIWARPALMRLREAFATSHITLVCGGWNALEARRSGLVDQVRTFDYFAKQAPGYLRASPQTADEFKTLVTETYDLVIDLRPEDDTRHLLGLVSTSLRAGIGARWRLPLLDIILPGPDDWAPRWKGGIADHLAAGRFRSKAPQEFPFVYLVDLARSQGRVIFGPYIKLTPGLHTATFWFSVDGLGTQTIRSPITFEVAADNAVLEAVAIDDRNRARLAPGRIAIDFTNRSVEHTYEFRIRIAKDAPFQGTLKFYGVTLDKPADTQEPPLERSDYPRLLIELVYHRARSVLPPIPRLSPAAAVIDPI